MLAVGNQNGKVYLWDIDVDDPSQARCQILSQFKRCSIYVLAKLAILRDFFKIGKHTLDFILKVFVKCS